jgi:hypothetical protein
MKRVIVGALLLTAVAATGCKPAATAADASAAAAVHLPASVAAVRNEAGRTGRFLAVGIYSAGEVWSRMAAADDPKAPANTSKVADDQSIIVVEDSQTGEVRACGDMTGHCISMNPWNKALILAQIAPIHLTPSAPSSPSR